VTQEKSAPAGSGFEGTQATATSGIPAEIAQTPQGGEAYREGVAPALPVVRSLVPGHARESGCSTLPGPPIYFSVPFGDLGW
jgi:hypothetical protein